MPARDVPRVSSARLATTRWRALLLVAAFLVPLLVAEGFFRVATARRSAEQGREFAMLGLTEPPGDGSEANLVDLLQPSPNQRLLFELKPNLTAQIVGRRVVTDSSGFRIAESARGDMSPAINILGIGDSVMFGWGVSGDETYLSRLGPLLAERLPGTNWRTINTAVPGYNTAIEVETLFAKGLSLDPRLVVLGWVNNDLDLPSFLRPLPSSLDFGRSFLVEWVLARLSDRRQGLYNGPQITPGSADAADYVARLPQDHRSLVGYGALENAMRRLAAAASEHRFEVVVLVHRGTGPSILKDLCGKHGFFLVSAQRKKRRFMRARGIDEEAGSVLTLSARDAHPSALGHQLVAEALADFLIKKEIAAGLLHE